MSESHSQVEAEAGTEGGAEATPNNLISIIIGVAAAVILTTIVIVISVTVRFGRAANRYRVFIKYCVSLEDF